jgi:hypothetical protein
MLTSLEIENLNCIAALQHIVRRQSGVLTKPDAAFASELVRDRSRRRRRRSRSPPSGAWRSPRSTLVAARVQNASWPCRPAPRRDMFRAATGDFT